MSKSLKQMAYDTIEAHQETIADLRTQLAKANETISALSLETDNAITMQAERNQLKRDLAKANERVEELQDALVDDAKAKAMLNKLTIENGELNIKASGNIFHVFCETFVETFKGSGATNYLVAEFNSEDLGAFTVTMQRSEGLTVYQKLNDAVERVAELEQANLELAANVEACCELTDMDMGAAIERLFEIDNTESKALLNKFAIEKKIEALKSFASYAKGDDWEDAHLQEAIKIEIEQLRKEQASE